MGQGQIAVYASQDGDVWAQVNLMGAGLQGAHRVLVAVGEGDQQICLGSDSSVPVVVG